MRGRRNDRHFNSANEEFDPEMITGRCPELGKEICRILRTGQGPDREISPREAGRTCGLNYVTINNARKGDSVEPGSLIKFAIGMGANINKLLTLSGHNPLKLTEQTVGQIEDFLPEGYTVTIHPPEASKD